MKKIVAQNCEVVVGVDVHTDSHVIAVKNDGDIVDRCKDRGTREDWEVYLRRFPGCRVQVVYEAGPNGYNLHDLLKGLDGEDGREISVYLAPPSMIPEAAGKKQVKTDRRDAVKLIQAFECGSFRPVVVPDEAQRGERQLVRERHKMKKEVNRVKNRIHGMIKFHGLKYPGVKLWSKEWRASVLEQAKGRDSGGHIHFVFKVEMKVLEMLEDYLARVEKRIAGLFGRGKRKEVLCRLTSHPGIGPVMAAVIATEVADFHAFDNSSAFASYTGLVSGARGTGKVMHLGPITKVGNRRLRWVFVESAWMWVRHDPRAKLKFELLRTRRGARRAIVAMARHLAVRVYHLVVNGGNPIPIVCHD